MRYAHLATFGGILLSTGCSLWRPPRLPQHAPPPPALNFTGPEEGWPPQPRGRTQVKLVPWTERPGSFTDADETRARAAALADPRVRAALGARFAFIGADPVEPPKEAPPTEQESLPVRVTFFSHTNNVAVVTVLQGATVERVSTLREYQPPESREEQEQAVALARRSSALRRAAAGLPAMAILTFVPPGRPGAGHRVLHVVFRPEDRDVPVYMALVDLTIGKVLKAGPARPEGKSR